MTKEDLQPLSPCETEILRLVWQLGDATVQQICERLPAQRKIAYATVQTLLRRLEKKGYLKHRVEGKAHLFHPTVARDHVIKRSVNDFLERLFGGDPIPLVQHLAEHGRIDAEDLERLKKLVENK
ncbi:MAG: BlaI/MecI/CopY family transcriptional regulator [Phycisphaerales bacterium]